MRASRLTQLAVCSGAPWSRVVFTTYALSLTFFETVVLDELVRGGARDILILSDVEGVRCSLSEKGVRGAGRDYRLEPVALSDGKSVFHPKLGAFIGDDDAMLTVGSGNLTFGGWANNLEMVEFLHPSFAASAFEDVAGLFEALAADPRCRHCAAESCEALAADLRRSAIGHIDRGDMRVLHGLTRGIGTQIEELASELGGATRLAVASPYFDDGSGLAALGARLQLSEAFVHRHGATAAGTAPNWPRKGMAINPVSFDFLKDDDRPLHAKAFEVVCRKGRLLVAGSANASSRALGEDGNVEAVTVRIQRGNFTRWGWAPAEAPPWLSKVSEADESEGARVGVLRAQLDGPLLSGWILTPRMAGPAKLEQVTNLGPELLGAVEIDADGSFRFETPGLEMQTWNAGRLVLRVSNDDCAAEGYASSTAATTAARRMGSLAPRLFAFLGGSDTPEDVAALLDWIFREPDHLPGMLAQSRPAEPASPGEAALLTAADLSWTPKHLGQSGGEAGEARVMARIVEQLRRSLRTSKGPYEPPLEVDDEVGGEVTGADAERQRRQHETAVGRSDTLTQEFLEWALEPDQVDVWGVLALELLNHMAQRLDWPASQILNWLERIAGALTPWNVSVDDRPLVAGSLLALIGRLKPAVVRAHLIRLRVLEIDAIADPSLAPLFIRTSGSDMAAAWAEVAATRSVEEVVAEFVQALRDPANASVAVLAGSPLKDWCPDEWPILLGALTSERTRSQVRFGARRLTACPKCYSALPVSQSEQYRTRLVATAKNCGHGVIIFGGDAT